MRQSLRNLDHLLSLVQCGATTKLHMMQHWETILYYHSQIKLREFSPDKLQMQYIEKKQVVANHNTCIIMSRCIK